MKTTRRDFLGSIGAAALASSLPLAARAQEGRMQSWPLKTSERTGIHDVAPAPDGGVWFTAQRSGHLGWFEPKSGKVELIALGSGSKPHGVIQGPDKAAWITDSGLQAMVRVGWPDRQVKAYPLPEGGSYANLNTCSFDHEGNCWFTGQSGIYGKVNMKTGQVVTYDAPKGRGPYGICTTPSGDIWYCSLAGSFIAQVDRKTGESIVVEPPTRNQGARRVWSDSRGRIWVSEWTSGNVSVYDPKTKQWGMWKAPGQNPRVYAVYVDEADKVWISEWSNNAMYRFDPATEKFDKFEFPRSGANIRQIHGRKGEIWLPESGTEHISVIRT